MWHVQQYHITAQDLEKRLGIRSFETYLVRRRLRWLGVLNLSAEHGYPGSEEAEMVFPEPVVEAEVDELEVLDVVVALNAAFDSEQASFTWGKLVAPADGPGEDSHKRGICCDATKDGGTKPIANATRDCSGAPYPHQGI
jgi:hypothetical protein